MAGWLTLGKIESIIYYQQWCCQAKENKIKNEVYRIKISIIFALWRFYFFT